MDFRKLKITAFSRIALAIIFCCQLFSTSAQDNPPAKKAIITFRERYLHAKPQADVNEPVDSMRILHLMIGGNLYQTEQHVSSAYNGATGKYDFREEFRYIEPLLNLGDVSVVNLKTSFGDNVNNMFSVPDEFALALKYSGINTVMHANVHTANIDKATLKRTRDLLNEFDMFHAGAYADNVERLGNYPLIVNKKGFRIAFLNYTILPNRPSISRDFIINETDKFMIEHDMRLAKANKPDFIIVYFDWGVNDQDIPSSSQQDIVRYAFEQGANLVVGALPNTPMRLDFMEYEANGLPHEGIVAYSLGNLVGSDEGYKDRNGYLLDMELQKNNYTGETQIGDWGIIPVYTYYDTITYPGKKNIYSVPAASIENGDLFGNISYIEKRRAINSAYGVRQLLGATADEIQYHLNDHIVNNVKETIDITNASLNNKHSPIRHDEIKPSPAPVLPVTSNGTNEAPSLALLYKAPEPPPAPKEEPTPKAKTQRETAIEKQRKAAEQVFDEHAIEVNPTQAGGLITAADAAAKQDEPVKARTLRATTDTIYKIQFYVLKNLIPIDTNYYTHLKGYEVFEDSGTYKYVVGNYTSYKDCYRFWKSQMEPRYKQSIIVKFINGGRILE